MAGAESWAHALDAAGASLALALPAIPPDARLEALLCASTSRRLLWTLEGRKDVLAALRRAAWHRFVVLDPVVSVGVWLPGLVAPRPLPVWMPTLESPWGRPWEDEPTLAATVGPVSITGLVPVGVGPRSEVWVHPPDHPLLALDPVTSARLRGVAELLDARAARDDAHRRSAAHRDSNVLREQALVTSWRQFKHVSSPDPDPTDRRDWRLGGEATFDQWLAARGFPHLRG